MPGSGEFAIMIFFDYSQRQSKPNLSLRGQTTAATNRTENKSDARF